MKIRILILLFLMAQSVTGGTGDWMIKGKVLSVTEDGILVFCDYNPAFGLAKPNAYDVVFIQGAFGNTADGDLVDCHAYPIGTYHYTAANGAAKTVRSFALRR